MELELIEISLVTAAKFFDDHYYDNLYYSKVGGISLVELNRLELELIFMIDFMLSVPSTVFATYRAELMRSTGPPSAAGPAAPSLSRPSSLSVTERSRTNSEDTLQKTR